MTAMVPERIRVRRHPERGVYDTPAIHAILDEALVAHVGFEQRGEIVVLPTLHARVGEALYLHGAAANAMLAEVGDGKRCTVEVTLLDGIVFARSVYNHSANYRSAVLFGRAWAVHDPEEKMRAFRALVEHVAKGRWDEARRPNEREMRVTTVARFEIEAASAKVRFGPPKDDPEDLALPVWAGVRPLTRVAGSPVAAPEMAWDAPVARSVDRFERG